MGHSSKIQVQAFLNNNKVFRTANYVPKQPGHFYQWVSFQNVVSGEKQMAGGGEDGKIHIYLHLYTLSINNNKKGGMSPIHLHQVRRHFSSWGFIGIKNSYQNRRKTLPQHLAGPCFINSNTSCKNSLFFEIQNEYWFPGRALDNETCAHRTQNVGGRKQKRTPAVCLSMGLLKKYIYATTSDRIICICERWKHWGIHLFSCYHGVAGICVVHLASNCQMPLQLWVRKLLKMSSFWLMRITMTNRCLEQM